MAASHLPGEPETVPEEGIDDAFLDALAGLDSVCRYLAIALGEARPGGPDPGDAPSNGPGEANREPAEGMSEGMAEGMIDALLGLVSVHRTVSLVLAAAGTEVGDGIDAGEPGPDAPPAWSREVLR